MGKLRNVCCILVRKFKGKDCIVAGVSIDVMLELPKYEIFFSNLSTEDWGLQ
jgi:hypothetical protein